MTDYEILSLMISILGVVGIACSLLLEVLNQCTCCSESKKDRLSDKS